MVKKGTNMVKLLFYNKRFILTTIVIMFSIGSYTFSESTSNPNYKSITIAKSYFTNSLSLDIPIYYAPQIRKKIDIDKPKLISKKRLESVMGKGNIDTSLLATFLTSHNKNISITYATKLAELYAVEADHEGVNPELAFTQMCLETGFLRFNGTVDRHQNNFCGLGATGNGVKGLSFVNEQEGIRAHIQHLKAYGSTKKLRNSIVDKRFKYVQRGSGTYLSDLTGKWATDRKYDEKIRSLLVRLYKTSTDSILEES